MKNLSCFFSFLIIITFTTQTNAHYSCAKPLGYSGLRFTYDTIENQNNQFFPKRNAVSIVAGLHPVQVSGPFTLSFERIIGRSGKTAINLGFTPWISQDDRFHILAFPISITRITSPNKNSHFEYGLEVLYAYQSSRFDLQAVRIPLMYRYQNSSNIFFAAGFNLIIYGLFPTPTIKAGYRF